MSEIKESIYDFALGMKTQTKGSISKVGIIGCGSMGQDIALQVSRSGIDVVLIDLNEETIQHGIKAIEQKIDGIINNWGLTVSEKRAIMQRVKGSTDYDSLKDCELVIEAINTKKPGTSIEIRKEVFRKIENVVSQNTVICSNTATLMISELASVLKNPGRALGMHFMAPVHKIKIIEVVRSNNTSDNTFELANTFAKMINRKVIELNESPGNIHTRMVVPMINQACEILMEGVASVSNIDEAMRRSIGNIYGPFELADKIGLDKLLKWMNNLYSEFGEHKYKASPIIKRLVRSNRLGISTGIGFYKYKNGAPIEQSVTCAEVK